MWWELHVANTTIRQARVYEVALPLRLPFAMSGGSMAVRVGKTVLVLRKH